MNKFEMFLVIGLYIIPTILAIIWQVIDLRNVFKQEKEYAENGYFIEYTTLGQVIVRFLFCIIPGANLLLAHDLLINSRLVKVPAKILNYTFYKPKK